MNVRGANVIALASASVSALDAWTKTLTLAITFKPAFIFPVCIPYVKTFHMVP